MQTLSVAPRARAKGSPALAKQPSPHGRAKGSPALAKKPPPHPGAKGKGSPALAKKPPLRGNPSPTRAIRSSPRLDAKKPSPTRARTSVVHVPNTSPARAQKVNWPIMSPTDKYLAERAKKVNAVPQFTEATKPKEIPQVSFPDSPSHTRFQEQVAEILNAEEEKKPAEKKPAPDSPAGNTRKQLQDKLLAESQVYVGSPMKFRTETLQSKLAGSPKPKEVTAQQNANNKVPQQEKRTTKTKKE